MVQGQVLLQGGNGIYVFQCLSSLHIETTLPFAHNFMKKGHSKLDLKISDKSI